MKAEKATRVDYSVQLHSYEWSVSVVQDRDTKLVAKQNKRVWMEAMKKPRNRKNIRPKNK